jgi:DNA-binding CsgD family transcriptional regulator
MADLSEKLETNVRRLTHLVAVIGTDGKPQREQIRILALAGFTPKEIASLIGTTGNTVRVALTSIRKNAKSKKKSKKKE